MLGTVEVLVVAPECSEHTERVRERKRDCNRSWSGKLILFSLSPTIIALL